MISLKMIEKDTHVPKECKTQILRFRYISNAPAASCSHVSFSGQRLFVSTSTGQYTKNSHRLATLHFSFCVADKPSYPYAGLAECARRVSINHTPQNTPGHIFSHILPICLAYFLKCLKPFGFNCILMLNIFLTYFIHIFSIFVLLHIFADFCLH